jgi:superfamily II DNA helicase RecQ
MPYDFFQIPAHGGAEAAVALNRRLRSGRIAAVRKEFVLAEGAAFWAFCVEYIDGAAAPSGARNASKTAKVDYRELLPEADFKRYAKLRELRKELAARDAVPAYSVFTNEQLAAIVQTRVDSLAALGKIGGVGEARVAKYGAALLAALSQEAEV